jgi:stage II sporulation protein AA (anti-sigma F factor antagonist)
MSGVTFMDSSGIAVLLRTWRRVQEADAAMEVTAVPRQPWKVFATAGLPKIIPMSTL